MMTNTTVWQDRGTLRAVIELVADHDDRTDRATVSCALGRAALAAARDNYMTRATRTTTDYETTGPNQYRAEYVLWGEADG